MKVTLWDTSSSSYNFLVLIQKVSNDLLPIVNGAGGFA